MVISFLSFAIFAGGKYFAKNFCANSSNVVMMPGGKEFNQTFALSLGEKGKSLSRIASSVTPLCLKVSQISKKFAIWTLGSSCDSPPEMDSLLYHLNDGRLDLKIIGLYGWPPYA